MTTTAINYRDLCAYVAANAHRLPDIEDSLLVSWGEWREPSAEAITQAHVEAVDELVEDYLIQEGFLPLDNFYNICKGQPDCALCRKMRGWN